MKLLKKLVICLGLLVSTAVGITACGSTSNQDAKIHIGILQISTHGALDAARAGFLDSLSAAGYVDGENIIIHFDNPEGDESTLSSMAKTAVRDNSLILAIATPTASAVQTAANLQNSQAKILFTAVTDAVDAHLVASNEHPGGNITGTSDMNPVELQIALIQELIPTIEKIGILYTISEENSEIQANLAKAQATKMGLETIVNTVSDSSEIASVTRALINSGAQAIYIPTDNNLASNMPGVIKVTNASQIPVICGEENMVFAGGTIALGIDYYKLGKLTGQMAIEILNGKSPSEMPVQFLPADEYSITINEENVQAIGITIPDSIRNRA